MKQKNKIIILIGTILLIVIVAILIIRNKDIYSKATENINKNYDNTILKSKNISGNLKTTHTSNMVHSLNKQYIENYDFSLNQKDNTLTIYLNNKKATINIEDYSPLYEMNNLNNCKLVNKNKATIKIAGTNKKVIKNNYTCGNKKLTIYTTRLFNNYISSNIEYKGANLNFYQDSMTYNNKQHSLNYSNIKADNYLLKADNLKVYYSQNTYDKYSVMYKNKNFNIIGTKDLITFSMNCNIPRYSKVKIELKPGNIKEKDNYQEVPLQEILKEVLKPEVLELFN